MQVMFISSRWSEPKNYELSKRFILIIGILTFTLSALIALALYGLTLKYSANIPIPFLREAFLNVAVNEQKNQDQFIRENIHLMATQLGEIKAKMIQLEALGNRVSGLAGLKKEFNFNKDLKINGEINDGANNRINDKINNGQGGLEIDPKTVSLSQLFNRLNTTNKQLNQYSDSLSILENELLEFTLKSIKIPTILPVSGFGVGSGYGIRSDPFTGNTAFHQGIDFAAPIGTPIFAVASGVVVTVETHGGYGNMVEIDHGNNLITRYAHTSRFLVKVGDIVKRGQTIAQVGSTGRSTGPHLHFEVLVNGEQQNPSRFLSVNNHFNTVNN